MATTRAEVIAKVSAYVERVFGGTDESHFKQAFDENDDNRDGRISLDELSDILSKAGIGFRLARWAIAKEVIDVLDADGDGYVAWDEFVKEFRKK